MRKITHIVIHSTAASIKQTTTAILNFWRNTKGWSAPGYHILIGESETEQLLDFDKISNGVGGLNSKLINICYKGGDDKGTDTRTPYQKEMLLDSIRKAYEWCKKHHTENELSASPKMVIYPWEVLLRKTHLPKIWKHQPMNPTR